MKNTQWNIGDSAPEKVTFGHYFGQRKYFYNFAEEQTEDGWRWLTLERIATFGNRGGIISDIVRMKYSVDDAEAIVNNVLNDPLNASRMAEYKALQEWRAKAKIYADEIKAWADEHEVSFYDDDEAPVATGVELKPDGILQLAQALSLVKAQAQELPDEQAAEVPALFPTWESLIGESVEVGKRLFYAGRLWKVLQTHTIQENWTPDVASSLFTEVAAPSDTEVGTLDNPIPYNGNMELEEGKYYIQDGVVYRCIRSTGTPVYHPLSQLVGLYVEIVN